MEGDWRVDGDVSDTHVDECRLKHCPLWRITDKLSESIVQLKRCGSWALTAARQAVTTAQSGAVTMMTTLLIAGVILRRVGSLVLPWDV
jgi:hypothetical protein